MKNQTTKLKSTITHLVAACLLLATLGPPAAQLSRAGNGRGGPPQHVNVTFSLPGMCGFDVQVDGHGLFQVISLPRGNVLFAFGGGGSNTFTNLSDPSQSVTFNVTGEVAHTPTRTATLSSKATAPLKFGVRRLESGI